jgi:hypothetical protein
MVVTTEPFVPLARALLEGAGAPGVALMVLPHPLLAYTAAEVEAIVAARAEELARWAATVEGREGRTS